jgi:hydrogenase-4 component F
MTAALIAASSAPLAGALLATPIRQQSLRRAARVALGLASVALAVYALPGVDRLSAVFAALISVVSFLAMTFSTSIFPTQERDSGWASRPIYFILLGAFWSSMLLSVVSTSFVGLWIGISATTLATTFLVGFSGGKSALEAAWKYLILCSFGIAIALLGMLLLGQAALHAGIASQDALSWGTLALHATALPPDLVRLALLLMLLGFATKAGLVPMHAWLPDAHSKAPPSISALLSGLLVSCALYAIIRVQSIASLTIPGLFDTTLLVLGALSVSIATLLMLAQRDLKRLLAYSTIEHSGLVAIALSLGTPLGAFAAVYHLLCHACAKPAAFLAAGIVANERGTTTIGAMHGLIHGRGGKLLLIALLGLAGFPPFGLFLSELLVLFAAIEAHEWVALSIASVGLLLGFAALARLAIDTESGATPGAGIPHTPRLALAAASCLTLIMLATVAIPFVGMR